MEARISSVYSVLGASVDAATSKFAALLGRQHVSPAYLLAAVAVVSYTVYCAGLVVYRLYFSPLAKFPGPKLAAMTTWHQAYFNLVPKGGGQFPFEIKRMHKKYGPIVRINPDELHVDDPDFYDVLYSTSKPYDKLEKLQHRFSIPNATFSTSRADEHRVRRAAISPFFSRARVREQSAGVQRIMTAISHRLDAEYAGKGDGMVLNVQDVWSCLAFDTIMDIVFARPKNVHLLPDFRAPFTEAVGPVAVWCHVFYHFSFLLSIMNSLPDWLAMRVFPPFKVVFEFRQEMRRQIADVLGGRNEEAKQANEAGRKTLLHEMVASDMPAKELHPTRLQQESESMVGAGFETTAWTMTIGTFHIVNSPAISARLRDELVEAMPDRDVILPLVQLEKLPYLTAVVKETLRIAMGGVERLPRVNRSGPWTYGDWTIPSGVPVSMDQYHMHTDERVWGPDVAEFRPERWLGAEPRALHSGKPLDRYLTTFSRGSRMCVGLNLAYAEVYIGFATFFRRHELELFETTRRDVDFYAEHLKASAWPGSKGVRLLVK